MPGIISGTGHRPEKLFKTRPVAYSQHGLNLLVKFLVPILEGWEPERVIAGGALGYDTALALAALCVGSPLRIVAPFPGQDARWLPASREQYHTILALADEVVYVSDGSYSASKMQIRNVWMVEHSDHVLALWNGSAGGTYNCVRYADKVKKPVVHLWDLWAAYRKENGGL